MNIFLAGLRKRHTIARIFLFLFLVLSLGACEFPDTSAEPGSNKSTIQITVWDDQTQRPISKAEVYLQLPQQIFPVKYTDNTGRVAFEVDNNLLAGISSLTIQKDGYESQTHGLMLSNSPIFATYLVPVGATAVPREPTDTPIPPTQVLEVSPTSQPTETSAPTNTPTLMPTSTKINTPQPLATPNAITLTRREGSDTVYVLAGPDISNVHLGTLATNESAEVIGRTGQNEWLQIVTDRGVEGWVANCEVTLFSTNLGDVPITWTGLVTPKNCDDISSSGGAGISTSPVGNCVNVSLSYTDWPGREFDDILLSWSSVPSTAVKLQLWVEGPTNDGVTAYVIFPTFSDIYTPYKVELFKFEDGDFKPRATYTYVVQPYNEDDQIICTTQGVFVP